MRRGRKHAVPVPSVSFPAPLSDSQPPKASCPSALPDLAPGPPQAAAQQDPRLKDAKVLAPRGLPDPVPRPPPDAGKRSAPRPLGGSTEPAACRCPCAAREAGAQPRGRALPSVKTGRAAPSPPPRPPGNPGSRLRRARPRPRPARPSGERARGRSGDPRCSGQGRGPGQRGAPRRIGRVSGCLAGRSVNGASSGRFEQRRAPQTETGPGRRR